MNKLLEAAKAVIARWDTPNWKDVPAAAVYIGALRDAIAAIEAELAQVVEPVTRELPKLTNSDFERPMAHGLQAAFIDGWASCRDSEYSGDGAQNDAFNQSATLALCVAIDQSAAPQAVNAWIAACKGLPEIDTPVLVMRTHAEPAMYPMMRVDSGDGWLWAAYQGGPIEDPSSYEADDDYLVVEWTPLPKPPGATT